MSDEPDLSTLPARMRFAATIIEEAAQEYYRREPNGNWIARNWRSTDLKSFAEQWENEDRAGEVVKELAHVLREAHIRGDYEYFAEQLVASGWRKDS